MSLGQCIGVLAVVAGNYLFMVVRHETCHAVAGVLTGGYVIAMHLWPPTAGNLSWTVIGSLRERQPWELWVQAGAPYVMDVLLILGVLAYLAAPKALPRFVRVNLVFGGVVFPLCDLALAVGAYWFGANDLAYVFGIAPADLYALLVTWILGFAALAVFVLRRHPAAVSAGHMRAQEL